MMKLLQKAIFRVRERLSTVVLQSARVLYWRAQGMRISSQSSIGKIYVSWPHQVSIHRGAKICQGVNFKFDGIWRDGPRITIQENAYIGEGVEFNVRERVTIGPSALIASGCKFIDHDHGFVDRSMPMRMQCSGREEPILIEEDVWLGVNVVVLRGVTIKRGAIIAAGAVVTKNIEAGEIWAGVPAKFIGRR